jgi:PPM family protein phosphatase
MPLHKQRVRWSGMTHRGKVRANNEDAFLALMVDGREVRYLGKTGEADFTDGDFIFAVSDGMGGANSGEFASKVTVEKVTKLLPRSFRMAAQGLDSSRGDLLNEVCLAVHQELTKLGQSYDECRGMGATLTLVWLAPEILFFAHVGDSRLYHLPHDGGIRQVSHDHTFVGWMRREGQINEREQRTHPRRNALQQALGAGTQFVNPQIGSVRYERGDRFLLCTDGLVDALWDHHLEELMRSQATPDMPALAKKLIESGLETAAHDNLTALEFEVGAGAAKLEGLKV